jgi:hypothetical protein
MKFVVPLLVLLLNYGEARTVRGSPPNTDFFTAANFCYNYGSPQQRENNEVVGSVTVDLTTSGDISGLGSAKLAMYRDGRNVQGDDEDGWGFIFDTDSGQFNNQLSCAEMESYAVLTLDAGLTAGGVTRELDVRQFNRPRFWYFVLTCCDPSCETRQMSNVNFDVRLLNDGTGWSDWDIEFGVDEVGLQTMYLVFFILYLIYFFIHGSVLLKLKEINGAIHQFIYVFSFIAFVSFLSVTLNMVHYLTYGSDGIGFLWARDLGTVLDLISRILFTALLMMLAEGWTISTISLTSKSKMMILSTLSIVTLLYLALMAWEFFGRTPEMITPVLAQRVMSYILIAVWIFFAGWFSVTSFRSYTALNPADESQKPKRTLFMLLGVIYGLWIISLPVVEYIGLSLDGVNYRRFVTICNVVITALGFWAFTGIIWPKWSSKFFNEPTRRASVLHDDDYRKL